MTSPSNVPSVLAILLCDAVITEFGTLKKTLIGIFDTVFANQLPTAQKVGFYARLTDLGGEYKFSVKVMHVKDDGERAVAGAEMDAITATDRLAVMEVALNFPWVPLETLGVYEFQLFDRDMYLGHARLNFVKVEGGMQWQQQPPV